MLPSKPVGGDGHVRAELRNRVTAAVISGVIALALVSGCATKTASGASIPLRKTDLVVGAVPAQAAAALYVAQERGIFAAHGLQVTIKPIVSTSDVVPQLSSGTFDIVSGQVTTFIAAQAEGVGQFRVIAPGLELGSDVDELVTLPTSQIASPGQLAGQTIAVNAATGNGVLLTDEALSIYNVPAGLVTDKVMPFPQMSHALSAHQVAAAYCAEPYCTEMEQQIGATQLTDLNQGSAESFLIGGFSTTAAWLHRHERAAAEFVASINEAGDLLQNTPAVAARAFQASLGVSEQVASLMADGDFPGTVTRSQLLQIAALMIQFGELSPGVDTNAVASALLGSS